MVITAEALNVRSGPGVDYPAIALLAQGEEVAVIGQHTASGWRQVQLPDSSSSGWVSSGSAYVRVSVDTADLVELKD